MRKKTGIYGGTFNPIHNGHVDIGRHILGNTDIDEVWYVVSPQNPFKINQELLEDRLRFDMTKKALYRKAGLLAVDFELRMPKPSYMWNTLQALSKRFSKRDFVLIIGADNWQRFGEWYNAREILDNYELCIYPRRGYPVDEKSLPEGVRMIKMDLIDISSTEIRQLVKDGERFEHLVPAPVADTIKKLKLYR